MFLVSTLLNPSSNLIAAMTHGIAASHSLGLQRSPGRKYTHAVDVCAKPQEQFRFGSARLDGEESAASHGLVLLLVKEFEMLTPAS